MKTLTKKDFHDFNVAEPELIRLAGMYDVWDHRDPNAKVLQFGLKALKPDDWETLVTQQFGIEPGLSFKIDMLKATLDWGYMIKLYCDKQNEEYASTCAHTIEFERLTMCALNIGQRGNSDLFQGGIKPEHEALFAWRYTGNDNMVMVSLYHIAGKEHHDLSKIAVKYGGGGHKGACGFRVSLKTLAEILEQP